MYTERSNRYKLLVVVCQTVIEHGLLHISQYHLDQSSTQIGSTISNNVELSGRSSAHVNVYDVLAAIEECTCPAAEQLASSVSSAPNAVINGNINRETSQNYSNGGWEGLASFLFGPDWCRIPLEGEDPSDVPTHLGGSNTNNKPKVNEPTNKPTGGKSMSTLMSSASAANANISSTATGKQLSRLAATAPTTVGNEKNVSFTFDRQGSTGPGTENETLNNNAPSGAGRWRAPYLGNVAPFPIASNSRKDTSKSLHDLATEMEACREKPTYTLKRKSSEGTTDSSSKKKADVLRIARAAEDLAMKEATRMDDKIFTRISVLPWGCIREEKDVEMKDVKDTAKKAGDVKEPEKKPNAAAKVKFDASTNASNLPSNQTQSAESSNRKPAYVPKFMPPFPPTQENLEHDRQLSISSSKVMGSVLSGVVGTRDKRKHKSMDTAGKPKIDEVRQSVIILGTSTYWGSGWQDKKTNENDTIFDIGVASGEGGASSEAVTKDSTGMPSKKPGADTQVVQPLGRASGSRVSKLLEGSMN